MPRAGGFTPRDLAGDLVGVSRDTRARLLADDWPGNVRELSNVIEPAVVPAHDPVLDFGAELLPARAAAQPHEEARHRAARRRLSRPPARLSHPGR